MIPEALAMMMAMVERILERIAGGLRMDSVLMCPVCRGRLSVECRSLNDGRIQCWGSCGCGYRIGGGIAKSPWPFDVEAAVANALAREGVRL